MLKKTLATAAVVCAVPAIASASWFLSTQARSGGGTITTTINGVSTTQDVYQEAVFKSYTTSAGVDILVKADDGFIIGSITEGGVTTGSNLAPKGGTSYSTTLPGSKTADKDFSVSFIPTLFKVTANMTGGFVSPASVGNLNKSTALSAPLTFTFTAKPGYRITALTGVPAQLMPALPSAVSGKVKVTFPAGYKFSGPTDLWASAVNVSPVIQPILPQFSKPGSKVTLSATLENIAEAPVWTYVSGPANQVSYGYDANGQLTSTTKVVPGPAVALSPAVDSNNVAIPGAVSFVAPTVEGKYRFTVAAGGQLSVAVVNVVASGQAASVQCQYCHSANNVRTVSDTSSHASCQSCHFQGTGHPGFVSAGTVNSSTFMVDMDNVSNGNGTAAAKGTNFCASCHGVTGNAAQAIPALTTHQDKACSDCHSSAHDTHVASAACQACHATVHSAATMGTNGCLDCHDGHRPTIAKPLVGSVSHPAVTLYTFEEVGMQMNGGQPVPVQVDANGKGLPYSPKQTCGTSNCHVIGGVNYTYDKISDHAFHSAQGRNEFQDTADGKLDARKNKPWGQSTAMVGKW